MSTNTEENFRKYKLVLVGESNVGKSSLALRFVKDQFQDQTRCSVGPSLLFQHTVNIDNEIPIKFDIWDTAGQERFQSLMPMYCRGAKAAIVVYDIQVQESFIRAQSWVQILQSEVSSDIVIALAGNKSDLENNRVVKYKEAEEYANENNLLFMETSAKTDLNVNNIFLEIAKKLPKIENNEVEETVKIQLSETEEKPQETSNCCCSRLFA